MGELIDLAMERARRRREKLNLQTDKVERISSELHRRFLFGFATSENASGVKVTVTSNTLHGPSGGWSR